MFFDIALVEDALDREDHFVVVEGFGNIIDRSLFHRFHRRLYGRVAGHDQYRRRRRARDQFGTRLARQAQVGNDQIVHIDRVFLGLGHRCDAGNVVALALQQPHQALLDDGFVLDHQYITHASTAMFIPMPGRMISKRLPPPDRLDTEIEPPCSCTML